MQLSFGVFLLFFISFVIGNFVTSTPRTKAYRNLHPSLPFCQEGLKSGWTVLAQKQDGIARPTDRPDDNGWIDDSNNEYAAVGRDTKWETLLRCALQRHVIPTNSPQNTPIDYYLGFLEFQESGEPYSLAQPKNNGDEPLSADELKVMMSENGELPPITQLDVLKKHLSTGSNYVIVFAHGWRHDASIGDGNVADLRHYAAHVVRFLAQRCELEERYCDTKVTAIYIGWRGARVNEAGLKKAFGQTLGGFLGSFAAGATLFDRKPVSEQVAPGAISALRTLEKVLAKQEPGAPPRVNRMIVFGHSLGGNLFATGLEDDLIKAVRRHDPGEHMPPVLGDLVVLLNPASEATKWTSVQREVWRRIAFQADSATPLKEIQEGHRFFPIDQKPVILSVTAALAFPAGGLRDYDCQWINLDVDDRDRAARQSIANALKKNEGMFEEGIEYDWATHDLFPTFKFDFRPVAFWFDRAAARIEGLPPPGQSCATRKSKPFSRLFSTPVRAIAKFLRNFPFQNTNQELSHTIGHLDPPRPAGGILTQYLTSAAPFGTTHELMGRANKGSETHNSYATLADAPLDCPTANHWLTRARQDEHVRPNGVFWDSEHLAPVADYSVDENKPAAQLLHSFNLGGTAAITRANDPFWNIRAFDNALSRHDGYRLSSFICAMNQFVMDDITQAQKPLPVTVNSSEGAKSNERVETKAPGDKPQAVDAPPVANSDATKSINSTPATAKSLSSKPSRAPAHGVAPKPHGRGN